jgi:hypothetical protein
MKLLLLSLTISIASVLGSCKTAHHAQNNGTAGPAGTVANGGSDDSLAYVSGIRSDKAKYLNKPFSVLLNDLKMPVRSYSSQFNDRVSSGGIMISFNDQSTTVDKSEGVNNAGAPVQLYIEWEQPVLRADITSQLTAAAGQWHDAEQHFYAPRIVKDIR